MLIRCTRLARLLSFASFLLLVLHSTADAKRPFRTPSPSPTPAPTPAPALCITITAPAQNSTVTGSVPISTIDTCSGVWFERLYVDGSWVGDFATGQVVFSSTGYPNGNHLIEVTSQSANPSSVVLGSATVQLNVQNTGATPTPSPVPTASPSPSPSPTPAASCISITAPAAGATVSGSSIGIKTQDTCSGLWFESLYVDGSHVNDFAPGTVVFNSTTVANGTHTIKVTSQSANPGSIVLGSASEALDVENGLTSPTPSSAVSPTPGPSATATATAHLSNLPPKAALPSESTCAILANEANFPETTPENVNDGTGWNANNQSWTTPSYFYTNAGRDGLAPASDFAAVDGSYSGTTQDIIRWAACKWGVDEDWAYAQTAEETGSWTNACAQLHGGTTCSEGGDCGNPDANSGGQTANLSFLGFPVTNSSATFIGTNGYGGRNANGSACSSSWASWSIIQSKTNAYEWYTWPMLAISTAWGEDYRWAKWRACVNGDYANFFGNSSDYLNAVSRAQSNPGGVVPSGQLGPVNLFTNETNLQYLALGCVGTHFSGGWYDSGAVNYLTNSSTGFLYHLNGAVWPGGRR
jgi:hypothetical protein